MYDRGLDEVEGEEVGYFFGCGILEPLAKDFVILDYK
jgi:hypothetical protein